MISHRPPRSGPKWSSPRSGTPQNDEWLTGSGVLTEGRLLIADWGVVAPGIGPPGRRLATPDVGIQRRALGTTPSSRPRWPPRPAARPVPPPGVLRDLLLTEQFGLNLRICGEVPAEATPVVVDGDLSEYRALLQWEDSTQGGAAASVNFRIPIPKLRRLAQTPLVAA